MCYQQSAILGRGGEALLFGVYPPKRKDFLLGGLGVLAVGILQNQVSF
jgi:hypothetical protein